MNRRTQRQTANNRRGLAALVLSLALALFAFAGVVGATGDTLQVGAPGAQATPAASAPPAGDVPAAQQTAPIAVPTGAVPAGVATGEPGTGNPDAAAPGQANPGSATGTAGSTQGGFPWLAMAILAVVVVLGIIAFLMMRSRRAAVAGGPDVVATTAAPSAPRTTSTTTTTTTATSATTPAASAAAAAAAPAAAATATGTPATITCPNCGTENQFSENFCHECGQDLRATRQQILAAAAPGQDVVTDDMPYLETLDRTDEQLEYVLSRPRVVLGTAAGCDVVISDVFQGHETVSPRHAELRKEGDSFTLVDLGSEQGSFVNDVRTGENLLSDGDEVRLGSVRFVYRVPQV